MQTGKMPLLARALNQPPASLLTYEGAADQIGSLSRQELLRLAAEHTHQAVKQDGVPSAALANRNSLVLAAMALTLLLERGPQLVRSG